MSAKPRPILLGCPVDPMRLADAVEWVSRRIASGAPGRVGVVNAAKLVKMESDRELFRAVSTCELIIADGMSVVWALPLVAGVRTSRVAGIDLMEALVEHAAEKGHRVYFLGARSEILERMLTVLEERYPTLRIAGSHHGYFTAEEEPALVASIRETRPDLLFVAMGTPMKEFWIDRNWEATGAGVSMGVGGSFDVLAGLVRRAPRWMQQVGLEWFYRMAQEPGRLWKRYVSTGWVFVWRVIKSSLRRPGNPDGGPS